MRAAISCLLALGALGLATKSTSDGTSVPAVGGATVPIIPADIAPTTVTCTDGYVPVDGVCKEYCAAKNVWTGRCDPNCARWIDDFCAACLGMHHLKEGICARLLWTSGKETLIADGTNEHSCFLASPVSGRVDLPGANWIFDKEDSRMGTYLMTEEYEFDQWVQVRVKKVTLDVACDDSCKILFNGNLVAENMSSKSSAQSFDITRYVRIDAAKENPNRLEIHVKNTVTQGGTVYKLVTHQNCPKGADDVEGVCVCRVGWIPLGEMCIQTAWISGTDTLIDHPTSKPATIVSKDSTWPENNAPYVWDTTKNKVGTFRFLHYVVLSDWLKPKVTNVMLYLWGGDSFRVIFNGKSVIENGSTKTKTSVDRIDLTKYFDVSATDEKPNVLQIFVINKSTYGGLTYKLVVYQKCPPNAVEMEGVCKCKTNFAMMENECVQVSWTSDTDTMVEGATSEKSVVISTSLKDIPSAKDIWYKGTGYPGTYVFTSPLIYLSAWLRTNVASVSIAINADKFFQISLNDVIIADKAGGLDKDPLTYDLTPYFRTNVTASNPNILKIVVTRGDASGALTYKLVVHMKCPIDAVDKDGVCECKSGFAKALGRCIKTAWYSDCPESKWSASFHAPAISHDPPLKENLPGSLVLNDGQASGTQLSSSQFNVYRHEIVMVDWLRTRIKTATLKMISSNCASVTFNDVVNGCIGSEKTQTFDMTSYLSFNSGSITPSVNDLRIVEIATDAVEKMSYKLTIELKCAIGAEEINGACRCKAGYSVIEGECVQFTWVSRIETQAGDGEMEHFCFIPNPQTNWRLVPGSTFIWDQDQTRLGTFRFSTLMPLGDWIRSHLDRTTLDIFADDFYKVAFNGNIVGTTTSMVPEITSYDVTQYMTNTTKSDLLEIDATNTIGDGGLSYKLVAHLKCPPYTVDKDGACVCLPGFGLINDVCNQGAWTSGPDTYLGEGKGAYPAFSTVRNTFENWMWHFSMSSEGTNHLYHKIVVPNAIKPKVTGATLYLNAGDSAKVIFNGEVIAERAAYSSQPYSYDVGHFLKLDATDNNPNLLEFWVSASSSASVIGVFYKFVLRLNCGSNKVDVDGVCQCKFGYTSIAGVCYQAVWISDKTTKTGDAAKETSILLTSSPGSNVPGANWIWYQDPNKLGTFRFSEQIALPSILRDKVTKVSVTVSVDEYFLLIFNGETIVDKFSGQQTYDLTTKFKTAADTVNVLEIFPTNTAGTGGLAYKFVVQTTCQPGAENIEGMCKCKQGFHTLGDACLQTAWYSGCPQTGVSISLRNSLPLPSPASQAPLDMTRYIVADTAGTISYVTFIDKIRLTGRVLERMERAELATFSNVWYRIKFNDQSVTEHSTENTSTYDLTSMLLRPVAERPYATNELKIQVNKGSNLGKFLSYSFRIVQRCPPNMEDVRGTCKCKWNFSTEGNTCVQRAWVSDLDTLVGSDKHKPVIVPPLTDKWKGANAKWIWDGDANKDGTIDYFKIIQLPTALKQNLRDVSLIISTDLNYRLVINNNEIASKAGVSGMKMTYIITDKIVFSDSPDQNTLQMTVTNTAGKKGGFIYQFTLNPTCPAGQKDVDGVCVCADDWVLLDGVCTQLRWSSSASTMVGDGMNLKPAVIVAVDTRPIISDYQQIWNTADLNPGTFSFWEEFVVSDRFERDVYSAYLFVMSDEYFRVVLNNQVIVDKENCNKCLPVVYDVSAFVLYSDKVYTQKNVLQITATSTDKVSYVSYMLIIRLARN